MKTIKVALCLPWYNGPDKDCVGAFLVFQHHLGRLQEYLRWMNRPSGLGAVPVLDPPGDAAVDWLAGTNIEFALSCMIGVSLPGMAREKAVEGALAQGADYLLFYDADMVFESDIFLKLLRHQKPVVGALAFTARDPIAPVIYDYTEFNDQGPQLTAHIQPNLKYERDTLLKTDAIGFGVVLIQASVFRRIPKPWFNNPGVGEDIQFCLMCKRYGIDIFVDTSAKTLHKPRYNEEWNGEEKFLLEQDEEYLAAKVEFRNKRVKRLAALLRQKEAK